MRSVSLTTLVFLLVAFSSFGQSGYKIDFTIKGWKDTTVYLGHYYGEQTYVKDTALVSNVGAFSFFGSKSLPQGVYFLVVNKSRIFDFVVGFDQQFALETSDNDYIKNMNVIGDEDNKLFFGNMVYNMERHKEAEPFIKILQDSTLAKDDPKKKEAQASFSKVNEKVNAYQKEIIEKYPTTLTTRLFKVNKQIDIPEPPKNADGSIDSTFQLKYYREHYFDNFDLSDDALIRLPKAFYVEKLKDYLGRL